MAKRTPPTYPASRRAIQALGARLRSSRLRRKMTQALMAERVGVSIPTLKKLEDGDPTTSLATVVRVLAVLGLSTDLDKIAAEDALGRELQDIELKSPRASRPRVARKAPEPPPARDTSKGRP